MSRIATNWAWSLDIKPATLKLVLLSMADRAGEYHTCFPSIDRLVKDTSLNKKTVQSGINDLIKMGLVSDTGKRVGSTQRVRVLKLNIPENGNVTKLGNIPENGTLNVPENGNVTKLGNIPENGTLNVPENGTLNVPENGMQNLSVNYSYNQRESAKGKTKTKESKTESYLPEDWQPDQSYINAAKEYFPDWQESRTRWVADGFKQYWLARSGATAKKRNWMAAWRSWLRKEKDFMPSYQQSSQPDQPIKKPKAMPIPGRANNG